MVRAMRLCDIYFEGVSWVCFDVLGGWLTPRAFEAWMQAILRWWLKGVWPWRTPDLDSRLAPPSDLLGRDSKWLVTVCKRAASHMAFPERLQLTYLPTSEMLLRDTAGWAGLGFSVYNLIRLES